MAIDPVFDKYINHISIRGGGGRHFMPTTLLFAPHIFSDLLRSCPKHSFLQKVLIE